MTALGVMNPTPLAASCYIKWFMHFTSVLLNEVDSLSYLIFSYLWIISSHLKSFAE